MRVRVAVRWEIYTMRARAGRNDAALGALHGGDYGRLGTRLGPQLG